MTAVAGNLRVVAGAVDATPVAVETRPRSAVAETPTVLSDAPVESVGSVDTGRVAVSGNPARMRSAWNAE